MTSKANFTRTLTQRRKQQYEKIEKKRKKLNKIKNKTRTYENQPQCT